jgi:anti-sigma regulatory factor (Ser/Thr protein kinase)
VRDCLPSLGVRCGAKPYWKSEQLARGRGAAMAEDPGTTESSRVPDGASPLYDCQFSRDDLGSVRTALARLAGTHGLADRAQFNFILAVNELTTNAILHGGGKGSVRLWHHGGALWCEISDTGRGIPAQRLNRMREHHPNDRGHGLWLAQHICAEVHVDTGRRGTRVLVCYPLPPAQPVQ